MTQIREAQLIDIKLIHPNEWNPNEQTDETFNNLVEEVEDVGFKHPLTVVPCYCDEIEGGHYKILGGEHRYKAGKFLGFEALPCFIEEGWDEQKQKLKTVRDNLISGELNSKKFTKLVNELVDDGIDYSSLPGLFAFDSEKEFEKYIIKEKTTSDKNFVDSLMDDTAKKETFVIDSLADIVGKLFSQIEGQIERDYLVFTYKGKIQSVVIANDIMKEALEKMASRLSVTDENVNDFLVQAISERLSK
jgi:hypothetical protein